MNKRKDKEDCFEAVFFFCFPLFSGILQGTFFSFPSSDIIGYSMKDTDDSIHRIKKPESTLSCFHLLFPSITYQNLAGEKYAAIHFFASSKKIPALITRTGIL
jgi:hypothetical protein